jgi:diguanylate cyclase (GGDEF)-like protein
MNRRPASPPEILNPEADERVSGAVSVADQDRLTRAASLLGVPTAHLTRPVQGALIAMLGEVEALRRELAEVKEALAEAEASADFDPLVSVYNRRAFLREAARVVAMVRRHEIEASLIFFDLDRFKEINDRNGHAAGDAALRQVGEVLIGQTRETDIIGRLGGDEFAVVLTHIRDDAAQAKAEALAQAIAASPVRHEGRTLSLSASIGVAHFGPDASIEQLLEVADEAMFIRKARRIDIPQIGLAAFGLTRETGS